MNTETTDTRKDYEIARDELNKLFDSLNLKVSISEPFGMVTDEGWQCIRYTVTINGEPFTYSLGVGHVDWQKPFKYCRDNFGSYNPQLWHYSKRLLGEHDADTIRAYCTNRKFPSEPGRIPECAAKLAKIQKKQPNPAEVLACVCREGVDADASFANWCADFDGDTDSIKALSTYNLCTENGKKARRLLSPASFQKMAELSAQL